MISNYYLLYIFVIVALLFTSTFDAFFFPLKMSTPAEVATRGLEQAQESLREAERTLRMYQNGESELRPGVTVEKLEAEVKECRAREERFFKAVYPNTGNCN